MATYCVILEVEEDAEVVEEAAEGCHFAFVRDVVAAAGGLVVVEADVVAAVVFEGVADVEPFVGEGDAAREERFDFVLEGEFECVESSVVFEVGAVGLAQGFKFASELVGIESAGSIAAFVLDEVNGAVFAEELDALEPVVVIGVFFAIVCHEEVAGAIGEEELMGLVVDFLSAEVPNVDFVVFAVGTCEFPFEDVDAFGGGVFGFGFKIVVGVDEFVGKTGFTRTAFADKNKFCFI